METSEKKIIYENGEYYIGEFKNNKRHGKGILYANNSTIKNKGIFINDEYKSEYNNYKSRLFYYLLSFIVVIFSILILYRNYN